MLKITDHVWQFSAQFKFDGAKIKWLHLLSTAKVSEDPCFAKWITRRSISHTPHCWGSESTCHSLHTRIQSKQTIAENCGSIRCPGLIQDYSRPRSDLTLSQFLAILLPLYAFQSRDSNLGLLLDSRSELCELDWGTGSSIRPFICFDLQQDSDLWCL